MKYLLFAGNQYYPRGGASDFVGVYDTQHDAERHVPQDIEWAHVATLDDTGLHIVSHYAAYFQKNQLFRGSWKDGAEQ